MTEFLDRKSPRLRDYDYATLGAYFVTICTRDRARLFGEVVGGEMACNEYGRIISCTIDDLQAYNDCLCKPIYCIMPNHIHVILQIEGYTEDAERFRTDAERFGTVPYGWYLPKILSRPRHPRSKGLSAHTRIYAE